MTLVSCGSPCLTAQGGGKSMNLLPMGRRGNYNRSSPPYSLLQSFGRPWQFHLPKAVDNSSRSPHRASVILSTRRTDRLAGTSPQGLLPELRVLWNDFRVTATLLGFLPGEIQQEYPIYRLSSSASNQFAKDLWVIEPKPRSMVGICQRWASKNIQKHRQGLEFFSGGCCGSQR